MGIDGEEMIKIARAVVSREFSRFVWMRDDLVSEGVLGIVRGMTKWSEESGVKPTTFAWACARNRMRVYLHKEIGQLEGRVGVSVEDMADWLGCEYDYDEWMDRCGWLEKVMVEARKVKSNRGSKTGVIAREIVKGERQSDVARKYGVSRQCVGGVFADIKRRVRKRYDYKNGEVIER